MTAITPTAIIDSLSSVEQLLHEAGLSPTPHDVYHRYLSTVFPGVSVPAWSVTDLQQVLRFLYSYRGSQDTFSAYRRDIDRLLQWSWRIKKKSIFEHTREDIEQFIAFCMAPPKGWIGLKNVARYKAKDGVRKPNPEWRPFVAKRPKRETKQGLKPDKSSYLFSQAAVKVMFAVLGSFYTYLVQEEVLASNPVSMIRQKSKYIRSEQGDRPIRRLSVKQWEMVLNHAREQASEDIAHERSLFVLSCLYGMYLRISELVTTPRWQPTMGDFARDSDGNWWFQTVGKGNKRRQIAVSLSMLDALKRYRVRYLALPPLPDIAEKTPLVGHLKNHQIPIQSDRPLRALVQSCFDAAIDALRALGDIEQANSLETATVHWLRHTGISDDVKHRPREHVRDDAGHSSSAITDGYIDIERKDRFESAKHKKIAPDDAH